MEKRMSNQIEKDVVRNAARNIAETFRTVAEIRGISFSAASKKVGIPVQTARDVLSGTRATKYAAVRMAKFFLE